MAEPALAAANAAASAATDIKQEHDLSGLEGLDFTLPPELAAKRPFQDVEPSIESPESKRAKVDNQADETSLEDGLALLVQNALSNVGDLVDQFGDATNDAPESTIPDPMDLDTSGPSISEPPAPRPTFSADPQRYVRDVNIHALGTLALSLLLILVQPPFDETMKSLRDSESSHGRSYSQLKRSLDIVRQLYSSEPALSTQQLDIRDTDSRTLIELANLAQLGSWLVEGTPKSLSDADDNFLALFQCQISDLSADMTELYLSIKTQRAIEFLVEKEPEKPSEEVIGEVLTQGLEDALREQHGGGELTSADQNFVSSVQDRKVTLQGQAKEQQEPAALRDKHPAEDLVRSFFKYVVERLRQLTDLGNTLGVSIQLNDDATEVEPVLEATGDADLDLDDLSSFFEKTASGLVQNALAGLTEEDAAAAASAMEAGESSGQNTNAETKTDNAPSQPNGKIDLMTDYKELEALVAESTSNYVKTTLHGLSPVPYQPTVPTSTTESMAAQLPYLAQLQHHQQQHPYYTYTQPPPEPQVQPPAPGENLPPNQTFPSAILYDKARQAALSKSSAHTRREGIHSTRRPWTQEEEKALMAGLDMVKGPHWSQILTLFGQSGTISDILKDRTQVQLKDKARNLKLFFLKTNSEMPYYLQAVTGELKTRAPTQAARKEAEERARLNSEEDQAKLQGIMALAGGLQHPPQNRTSASPANAHGAVQHAPSAVQHLAAHSTQTNAGQRPAIAPGSQFRTSADNNTHHALQSMPQAPPRPQAHLPPQVPRPQSQQQHQPQQAQAQSQPQQQAQQPQQLQQHQQHQQQQQGQGQGQPLWPAGSPQAPVANGQAQGQTASGSQNQTTPTTQHQPSIALPTTAAAQTTPSLAAKTPTPCQQTPSAPTSAPTSQPPQTAAAPASTAPPAQPAQTSPTQETPKSEDATPQDDNAAEAALLEGLQAVVAQSLASS